MESHVYTPAQIAEMLAISETAVYKFLAKQLVSADFRVLKIGKLYRIEAASFDSWLHRPQK